MSSETPKTEQFNAALVAEGLLWSNATDVASTGQTVLVDVSDPSASPDARNNNYLKSMVCAVVERGTDMATLAAAVRSKFDGDDTDLVAILGN